MQGYPVDLTLNEGRVGREVPEDDPDLEVEVDWGNLHSCLPWKNGCIDFYLLNNCKEVLLP